MFRALRAEGMARGTSTPVACTPAIVRELGRSLAATPPACLPLDRLEAAASAVHYPGAYTETSFPVWAAYEAVAADRAADPERQARFAAVPAGDRAAVAHHLGEVGALIGTLQRALAELRCREARLDAPVGRDMGPDPLLDSAARPR